MMRFHTASTFVLFTVLMFSGLGQLRAAAITGGTGPGGVDFTDQSSSDLLLWLDANSITGLADGAALSDWTNRATFTGAASDAGQGDPNRRATYETGVLNGRPVVRFDGLETAGLGDRYDVTGLSLGNSATAFAVALSTTQNASGGSCCRPLFSENTSNFNVAGYGLSLTRDNLGHDLRFDKAGANLTQDFGGAADSTFHLFGFTSNSTDSQMYDDGSTLGATIPTGTAPTGSAYTIGGNPNVDARHYRGDMPEIALYDRELNDAERQIVENYFAAKYALTVANDRYAGDIGGNGDYDYDVFGVGQLSGAGTSNSGSAGFGIEATGGLDDGDFLLAGHNNASGVTSADVPAGEASRWERVWYLDATDPGNDLASTLAFDFSDAGLTDPGIILSAQLLYSPTQGPFSFSNLLAATSINDDLVTFALPGNLLADGYYTLAFTAQPIPEPSSFALLGLGCCGLMLHRRRRLMGFDVDRRTSV